MDRRSPLGLTLISVGVPLMGVGILVWLGALSWFGRLPGDIRVERPGFRLYVPIVSTLILSLVLTALAAFLRRYWP